MNLLFSKIKSDFTSLLLNNRHFKNPVNINTLRHNDLLFLSRRLRDRSTVRNQRSDLVLRAELANESDREAIVPM